MTMTQQLSKPQSTKQIATRLVNECLRVQPNEQVVIASWDHTLEYANALALEVEHAGGISTSTLMGNDFYWAYLKEVPEEQYTRRQKGFLSLPVGLVTPERARTYGFDYENWQRVTTNSLDVDHEKISAQAAKIESKLRNATNLRITAANGTDLQLKLKNRPVHVHDGIIDRTDLDKGTLFEALPAGAVELAPDETSAQGKA